MSSSKLETFTSCGSRSPYPYPSPVSIATAAAVFMFPVVVEKPDRLVAALDIFSVGLFAVMGADKTMVYGYPPVTCVMMGFFTAVGGGMLRDVCLALDIFSVGLFAVMGADKTMVYGYPPVTCVMMGFFTAVGGGMLRDVCLARVPYIFQRSNLYAIAAIAGSIAYMALIESLGMWNIAAAVISVALTMFIRWWSIRYNIMSPTWNIAAAVISVALTMFIRWWSIRYNIMSPTEFDPHKLPEPVKKVARPVVRPIQRAGRHVSTKTTQAAARARDRRDARKQRPSQSNRRR